MFQSFISSEPPVPAPRTRKSVEDIDIADKTTQNEANKETLVKTKTTVPSKTTIKDDDSESNSGSNKSNNTNNTFTLRRSSRSSSEDSRHTFNLSDLRTTEDLESLDLNKQKLPNPIVISPSKNSVENLEIKVCNGAEDRESEKMDGGIRTEYVENNDVEERPQMAENNIEIESLSSDDDFGGNVEDNVVTVEVVKVNEDTNEVETKEVRGKLEETVEEPGILLKPVDSVEIKKVDVDDNIEVIEEIETIELNEPKFHIENEVVSVKTPTKPKVEKSDHPRNKTATLRKPKYQKKLPKIEEKSSHSNQMVNVKNDGENVETPRTEAISVTVHKMTWKNNLTSLISVNVYILNTSDMNDSGSSRVLAKSTRFFDGRVNSLCSPFWEEILIFYEEFTKFVNNDSIFLFEIIDTPKPLDKICQKNLKPKKKTEDIRIAWCYLLPFAKTGESNIGEKLRLQLYKYKSFKNDLKPESVLLRLWANKETRKKLNGSLYITIDKIGMLNMSKLKTLENVEDNMKHTENITDVHVETIVENDETIIETSVIDAHENIKAKWRRLINQHCKIPNKIMHQMGSGCATFVTRFSRNGLYLACANVNRQRYEIGIFSVIDGKELFILKGHQKLIYSLDWSKNDELLLSASGDCVAYVWDIKRQKRHPIYLLPHPSYVYSAVFYEQDDRDKERIVVLSGCYDCVIRVWLKNRDDNFFQLHQEMDFHKALITCVCVAAKNDSDIYTSDFNGVVGKWVFEADELQLEREFNIKELTGTPINSIQAHPKSDKLLVHGRDNILRMLDVKNACIVQRYSGSGAKHGKTNQAQTQCCWSACGNLIFAPVDDGQLYVWNTVNGNLLAMYDLRSKFPSYTIHCVQYHPHDHIVAVSQYSGNSRILLFDYDPTVTSDLVKIIERDVKKNVDVSRGGMVQTKELSYNFPKIVSGHGDNNHLKLENIIDKVNQVIVKSKK